MSWRRIRVLVVDDSTFVRNLLQQALNQDPMIEVIATAFDPFRARDMIVQLQPDVMTLDVLMPRMNGIEFLRKLMPQWPLPVIIVSSLTERGADATVAALTAGAIDFVAKPAAGGVAGLSPMLNELAEKIKAVAGKDLSHWKNSQRSLVPPAKYDVSKSSSAIVKVIAMGVSLGGPQALRYILSNLPKEIPGIVIAQHMPQNFTKTLADELNAISAIEVHEAKSGDSVLAGRALLAPGGRQISLQRQGDDIRVLVWDDAQHFDYQPSVDNFFESMALTCGASGLGIILTGMGHDGAAGLLSMRKRGARTLGQSAGSCIVYGMPRSAFELGAVERQCSLTEMPSTILQILGDHK